MLPVLPFICGGDPSFSSGKFKTAVKSSANKSPSTVHRSHPRRPSYHPLLTTFASLIGRSSYQSTAVYSFHRPKQNVASSRLLFEKETSNELVHIQSQPFEASPIPSEKASLIFPENSPPWFPTPALCRRPLFLSLLSRSTLAPSPFLSPSLTLSPTFCRRRLLSRCAH